MKKFDWRIAVAMAFFVATMFLWASAAKADDGGYHAEPTVGILFSWDLNKHNGTVRPDRVDLFMEVTWDYAASYRSYNTTNNYTTNSTTNNTSVSNITNNTSSYQNFQQTGVANIMQINN